MYNDGGDLLPPHLKLVEVALNFGLNESKRITMMKTNINLVPIWDKVWEVLKNLRILKAKKGEGFIDVLIQFAIIMSLIFCFLTLWKPFIYKQNLDYMAKTLVRAVEANGRINSEITALASELKSELGVSPSFYWNATYITGTDKIQLRKKFTLTVKDAVVIKLIEPTFGSPVVISIPIEKKFTGISQVYWK